MEAEFSDEDFANILSAFADIDDLLIDWNVGRAPNLGHSPSHVTNGQSPEQGSGFVGNHWQSETGFLLPTASSSASGTSTQSMDGPQLVHHIAHSPAQPHAHLGQLQCYQQPAQPHAHLGQQQGYQQLVQSHAHLGQQQGYQQLVQSHAHLGQQQGYQQLVQSLPVPPLPPPLPPPPQPQPQQPVSVLTWGPGVVVTTGQPGSATRAGKAADGSGAPYTSSMGRPPIPASPSYPVGSSSSLAGGFTQPAAAAAPYMDAGVGGGVAVGGGFIVGGGGFSPAASMEVVAGDLALWTGVNSAGSGLREDVPGTGRSASCGYSSGGCNGVQGVADSTLWGAPEAAATSLAAAAPAAAAAPEGVVASGVHQGEQAGVWSSFGAAGMSAPTATARSASHSQAAAAAAAPAAAAPPAAAAAMAPWQERRVPEPAQAPAPAAVLTPATFGHSAVAVPWPHQVSPSQSLPEAVPAAAPSQSLPEAVSAPVSAPSASASSARVSGAALLGELMAEAASADGAAVADWAAVAAGLAPLPAGPGKTAEELLAGLDLSEIFAPPKASHAKRIRGHVRRAAELKAQLADRVRAIQRLAAENADLRGRARVMEMVVRCRDEQLLALQSYRTSADGRVYYVPEHQLLETSQGQGAGHAGQAGPGLLGPGVGPMVGTSGRRELGTGAAPGRTSEAGPGAVVPVATAAVSRAVVPMTPASRAGLAGGSAALANMPAGALLEMFRLLVTELTASLRVVEDTESCPPSTSAHGQCAPRLHGHVATAAVAAAPPAPAAPSAAVALLPHHPAHAAAASNPAAAAFSDDPGDGIRSDGGGGSGHGNNEMLMAVTALAPGCTAGDPGHDRERRGAAATDAVPVSSSLLRLRSQISRFRCALRYIYLVNDEVCRFVDTRLTGETAPPEPGHWLRVVQALDLAPQQLADASALHACWQDWLGRVLAERRALTSALDQLLSVNRYGAAYAESLGQYGTDRDAIHRIHANVMREKVLAVLVGEVVCCQILNDIQWARAIVHSYPYVMDARELVRAAAELYHSSRGLLAARRER